MHPVEGQLFHLLSLFGNPAVKIWLTLLNLNLNCHNAFSAGKVSKKFLRKFIVFIIVPNMLTRSNFWFNDLVNFLLGTKWGRSHFRKKH